MKTLQSLSRDSVNAVDYISAEFVGDKVNALQKGCF